ncbi:MAG: hypothetical protein A3I14_13640 [Candidatus Rokubacteria bacterium RIFCSPLOWO2_02_FULL_73_56]|nr:MAG: hypothetical protein A3I14_13640 [Candidatus Rokubacteria bacterium RIFCSPLOWO2_02_FULL_73_56]
MHSNGIIQSGLSGKTFRTRAPVRVRMRRIAPGVIGPPLTTSTRAGRHARHARSSCRRIQSWYAAFVPRFL